MAEAGSKAKFVRDSLDKIVGLRVPQISPEEFQRMFNVVLTPEEIRDLTFGELMMRQLVLKACTGNDRSISDVLDRLLGKPVQTTESVTKSYSYHDLLIEMKNADAKESGRTITLPAPRVQSIAEIQEDVLVREMFSMDASDPLADL